MKLIRSHSVLRTASCRFHMPPETPAALPASQISAPRTASHLSPIICLYTCLSRRSAQPVAYTIPIVLGAHSSAQPSFQHLLSQWGRLHCVCVCARASVICPLDRVLSVKSSPERRWVACHSTVFVSECCFSPLPSFSFPSPFFEWQCCSFMSELRKIHSNCF